MAFYLSKISVYCAQLCCLKHPTGLKLKVISLNFSSTDGEKEGCAVQELEENTIYSRGNHKDFTAFLRKQTSQDNPKVLSMTLLLHAGLSKGDECRHQ